MNIRIVFCIALLAAGLLLAPTPRVGAFGWFDRYKDVTTGDEYIEFAAKDFLDREAQYFSFTHKGAEIRFFVIMDQGGVIRAAFDACDVCYAARKGYDQKGEYMICNNCGMHFHVTRINVVKGGCNPAPLKRDYDESTVRIRTTDILKGGHYFGGGA